MTDLSSQLVKPSQRSCDCPLHMYVLLSGLTNLDLASLLSTLESWSDFVQETQYTNVSLIFLQHRKMFN